MLVTRKVSMLLSVVVGVCLALSVCAHPFELRGIPNLEPSRGGKPYPAIVVSKGGDKLLSLGCPVTSSAGDKPERGEWAMITNGDKELDKENDPALVKIGPGVQWVQVDLRTSQVVNAVCIWRHHDWPPCVYRDVIVQVSDDAEFKEGVTTVFNNDHDNSAGLGIGEDKEYLETNEGRPIPVPGIRARYIRVYSNGRYSTGWTADNYCTEIEVYGGEPTSEEKVKIAISLPKPGFH